MRLLLNAMKGLVVAVVAALTPVAGMYLLVITDGVSIEETEGFNYAGLFVFSVFAGMLLGPTAAWLWNRIRKVRPWATIMFIGPSLVLVLLITLLVVSGDCLNKASPC